MFLRYISPKHRNFHIQTAPVALSNTRCRVEAEKLYNRVGTFYNQSFWVFLIHKMPAPLWYKIPKIWCSCLLPVK
jgi:hypothetical protein